MEFRAYDNKAGALLGFETLQKEKLGKLEQCGGRGSNYCNYYVLFTIYSCTTYLFQQTTTRMVFGLHSQAGKVRCLVCGIPEGSRTIKCHGN